MKRNLIITMILYSLASTSVNAQSKDSSALGPELRNTIRFNLSAPLIFTDRYLVFGYERMVKSNQSFSLNVGVYGLPDFITVSDSLSVSKKVNDKGFHISGDYRFYISGENRHRAPRGVYIGPYYSFNHLSRQNTWEFKAKSFSGNVDASLDVNIHSMGVELGYQFVLGKRFALDFVAVGPGMAHYSFKTTISAQLEPEKKKELLSAIAQRMAEKIPGGNKFLNNERYRTDAGVATWTIGYRYIVHVGYRF